MNYSTQTTPAADRPHSVNRKRLLTAVSAGKEHRKLGSEKLPPLSAHDFKRASRPHGAEGEHPARARCSRPTTCARRGLLRHRAQTGLPPFLSPCCGRRRVQVKDDRCVDMGDTIRARRQASVSATPRLIRRLGPSGTAGRSNADPASAGEAPVGADRISPSRGRSACACSSLRTARQSRRSVGAFDFRGRFDSSGRRNTAARIGRDNNHRSSPLR